MVDLGGLARFCLELWWVGLSDWSFCVSIKFDGFECVCSGWIVFSDEWACGRKVVDLCIGPFD